MTSEKIEPALPPVTSRERASLSSADRALRKAARLMAEGRYGPALKTLKGAIEDEPVSCRYMLRIAEAYRGMKRLHEALSTAITATSLFPDEKQGWELVLDLAEAAGDQTQALSAIEALIKISPRHIRAHTALSEIHLRNGNIPAARRSADILVRLDPESAVHHYTKALLCQHESRIAEAIVEFVQAICLDPDGPFADSARCFLQDLDGLQLNDIMALAGDDVVFRMRLMRNCSDAVRARGFALSPMGEQLLQEFCENELTETPGPIHVAQYH